MLYFIYPTSRIHFVYYMLKIKHMLNYIKRRYSLKVKIFYKDKETIIRLGN
jgi:ABC-type uncharacterized transport system involved in gliding motility auxiliary subunit